MQVINLRYLIIGTVMLAAAGLAFALTPRSMVADQGPKIELGTLIPKEFGDWKVDEMVVPIKVAPDVQAKLDKIYNQTLSRTYINQYGYRIMLSLAYGGNQSDSMQVHLPDICYPSQGFGIIRNLKSTLPIEGGEIPVKRLVAARGDRNEPITYWIRLGEKVAMGMFDRKVEQIRMAMKGDVADGILFRVSSVDQNDAEAYKNQDIFIRDLLLSLPRTSREFIVGKAGPEGI